MATYSVSWRGVHLLILSALIGVGCQTRLSIGEVTLLAATDSDADSEAEPEQEADDPNDGESPPKAQKATHHQTAIIRAATEPQSAIKAFVVAPDGSIIALVHLSAPSEDEDEVEALIGSEPAESGDKPAAGHGKPKPVCEVRIFSPDGAHKRTAAWRVGFMGQAIALGPENRLYIAGSGRVGRYSLEGKELLAAESPQTSLIGKDENSLREAALADIAAQKEAAKQTVVTLEQQRNQLEKRLEKASDSQAKLLQRQIKVLNDQIERRTNIDPPIERAMAAITERLKRVNAIAVSDKEVFVTCPQAKGYGYAVWRTDLDFANPECIVTGLSGCCGQMDVACDGGDLWVAENSRHRVVRYDREGKRLSSFGKRDRDGIGGSFGGCCNPMNLCFDKEGDVLVSESNGQVKHFTSKGKFVELCGLAKVQPGCKNSAVRISPDGQVIYYIDINKAQILVLTRNKKDATDDKSEDGLESADRRSRQRG